MRKSEPGTAGSRSPAPRPRPRAGAYPGPAAPASESGVPLERVVSGGQTGADRAALDWALRRQIPTGGWCPQGRLAEDGCIPARYDLQETPSGLYVERTEWNVRDSDATVILTLAEELTGGSLVTRLKAEALGKPCLVLCAPAGPHAAAARRLRAFVRRHRLRVLNVAGPRASTQPGIARFVEQVLDLAFPPPPRPE